MLLTPEEEARRNAQSRAEMMKDDPDWKDGLPPGLGLERYATEALSEENRFDTEPLTSNSPSPSQRPGHQNAVDGLEAFRLNIFAGDLKRDRIYPRGHRTSFGRDHHENPDL
jgi:hypothetical protein